MNIQEEQVGAVQVLRPCGALVGEDAEAFAARLRNVARSSRGRLVVDLGAAPFVDSIGLESLVEVAERLVEAGMALPVCNVNDTWREVLDLTAIGTSFEVYADRTSAVRSFAG